LDPFLYLFDDYIWYLRTVNITYDIELKLLYAALKKMKVAPVVELVNHWLHSNKNSTAIMCTSLITRLATSVDPHAANTIIYITTPRIMINESYLAHAHVIKRDETGKKILYYFPRYTNEIQLPNPDLAVYNSPSLTFTVIEREGRRRSSVSRRNSRRREQEEQAAQVAWAAQPAQPAQHTPPTAMPRMGWTAAIPAPRFTPGYGYGLGYVPNPYKAGGSSCQQEGRAGRRTEAQAQAIQRHMRQGVQASRARTLLRFRGDATPCSPSGHTGRPKHSHGRTGAPELAHQRYAECPHPDCYPMASANLAERH